MSRKKKFASYNELNKLESSKVSCFSQGSPKLPPKPRRLSREFPSRTPGSFRSSQIISSASADSFPFRSTDPVSVFMQDKNVASTEEIPSATSTPKKKSEESDDQPNKSDPRASTKSRKSNPQNKTDPGQSDLPPIKEETKDEYDRELYHTSPRVFKPRLYKFKNPLYNLNNPEKNSFKVLAPPFWVLVDHMIAVVWFLYSGDKREQVEIVHLQWALEFARWLRDEKGDHSKVVKNLIGVFQDAITDLKLTKDDDGESPSEFNESYEDAHTAHSKEDEMTSVTLKDILSRTSGLPSEKVRGPCFVAGPVPESSAKESPPLPPSTSPPTPQRPTKDDGDEEQQRLLKFLEQMREGQNDKVKTESNRLQDLDQAIEALREGKLKFEEWLKEHVK